MKIGLHRIKLDYSDHSGLPVSISERSSGLPKKPDFFISVLFGLDLTKENTFRKLRVRESRRFGNDPANVHGSGKQMGVKMTEYLAYISRVNREGGIQTRDDPFVPLLHVRLASSCKRLTCQSTQPDKIQFRPTYRRQAYSTFALLYLHYRLLSPESLVRENPSNANRPTENQVS